jgi:hypothetical protein
MLMASIVAVLQSEIGFGSPRTNEFSTAAVFTGDKFLHWDPISLVLLALV